MSQLRYDPHTNKALIKKAIFCLWPKMKIEKQISDLHVVKYFHNFAAFKLSVIGGYLEVFFHKQKN